MAARFGDGLNPEFRALLLDWQQVESKKVSLLDAPLKSCGPAHHDLTQAELDERGVLVLRRTASMQKAKDGTDG